MPNKNSPTKTFSNALVFVFAIIVSAAGAAVIAYFFHFGLHLHRPLATETATWGQFGDYFGGVLNPLVALGALLFLAVSVKIQNDTLREARTQLQLQRTELELTRDVLDKQREQLAAQAEIAQRQVFEATFFRLLETLRHLVENLEITAGSRGAMAMFLWALELRDRDLSLFRSEALTADAAAEVFGKWYSSRRSQLAAYFQITLMTLEFVERSKQPDSIFYTDILRSTLSRGELFLLFHHGVGQGGNARFKTLAEKYGLLDAFDPTTFDLPADRRSWYSAASRVPRNYSVAVR